MTAPKKTGAAQALRAAGVPIKLSNGDTVLLKYTMASVMALEENFGNLGGVMHSIQGAVASLESSMADATSKPREGERSLFQTIVQALAPGLLEAKVTDPRSGEEVWLGEHEDTVGRLLAFEEFGTYLEAFGASFAQAFHNIGGGQSNPPAQAAAAAPKSSRGAAGGTSPSAPRASRRKTSGS